MLRHGEERTARNRAPRKRSVTRDGANLRFDPGTRSIADLRDAIRQELSIAGVVEEILCERIASAAWDLSSPTNSEPSQRSQTATEQRLIAAIEALGRLRELRLRSWGTPRIDEPRAPSEDPLTMWSEAESVGSAQPEQWRDPIISAGRAATTESESRAPRAPWRERLSIDPAVSETSPVIKGTWVSVGHIISMIVDGWSWSDILKSHPELIEDDIRACLAYTVESEPAGVNLAAESDK
jgi:uncharacterized protein (DUF433 family)